jgi:hypothetical protein
MTDTSTSSDPYDPSKRGQQQQQGQRQQGQQGQQDKQASGDPKELKEYHYWVGHVETTAMLTPEMAERLNAKPVGEELPPPEEGANNESERLSSRNREASQTGTTNEENEKAAAKARGARNKRGN